MLSLIIISALKDSTNGLAPAAISSKLAPIFGKCGDVLRRAQCFWRVRQVAWELGKPGAGNKQLMGTYWALAR